MATQKLKNKPIVQKRVNKEKLVFAKTMPRPGTTNPEDYVVAPKGLVFHYEPVPPGTKVRSNSKFWWRFMPDMNEIKHFHVESLFDKFPNYLWTNFKTPYDFKLLSYDIKKYHTATELSKSWRKWQIEEPEIPIVKEFLQNNITYFENNTSKTELKMAGQFANNHLIDPSSIAKVFQWQYRHPFQSELSFYVDLQHTQGYVYDGKVHFYVSNDGFHGLKNIIKFNLDPSNALNISLYNIWSKYRLDNLLPEIIKKNRENLNLSIENLQPEGAGIIIKMDLETQEMAEKARLHMRKLNEEMETLLSQMSEHKYSKKSLRDFMAKTRNLTNFFKSWEQSKNLLPWT